MFLTTVVDWSGGAGALGLYEDETGIGYEVIGRRPKPEDGLNMTGLGLRLGDNAWRTEADMSDSKAAALGGGSVSGKLMKQPFMADGRVSPSACALVMCLRKYFDMYDKTT